AEPPPGEGPAQRPFGPEDVGVVAVVGAGPLVALAVRVLELRIVAGDRSADHAEGPVHPEAEARLVLAQAAEGDGAREGEAHQVRLRPVDPDRRDPAQLELEPGGPAEEQPGPREGEEEVGVLGSLAGAADGGGAGGGVEGGKIGALELDPALAQLERRRAGQRPERERHREGAEHLHLVGPGRRAADGLGRGRPREERRERQRDRYEAHGYPPLRTRLTAGEPPPTLA